MSFTVCGNCRYWVLQTCRRNAPVLLPSVEGGTHAAWPMTGSLDSCGEFTPAGEVFRESMILKHALWDRHCRSVTKGSSIYGKKWRVVLNVAFQDRSNAMWGADHGPLVSMMGYPVEVVQDQLSPWAKIIED